MILLKISPDIVMPYRNKCYYENWLPDYSNETYTFQNKEGVFISPLSFGNLDVYFIIVILLFFFIYNFYFKKIIFILIKKFTISYSFFI